MPQPLRTGYQFTTPITTISITIYITPITVIITSLSVNSHVKIFFEFEVVRAACKHGVFFLATSQNV